MKILLVEPNYVNKYPPLGLMKLSTYHKEKGDIVVFAKGIHESLISEKWDRIYISTLFTFYYNITLKTIKAYKNSIANPKDLFIGGPMASVMRNELSSDPVTSDITIVTGLLDKPRMIGEDETIVDDLVPDYSIIRTRNSVFSYSYPVQNDFLIHATHGCIRKCSFCAVPIIEPNFKDYCTIKDKIELIRRNYGDMRNLMIMDNNILASNKLDEIIDELVSIGFGKDNKSYQRTGSNRKLKRHVDFNQGLDARLLASNETIMKKLSRIEINPLRVAFDHASDEFVNIYKKVMYQAAENNIKNCSNYILFNHEDNPIDLYKRLRINVELNLEFKNMGIDTEIWSFPMKFSPIFGEYSHNRRYIGKKWSKKYLRAIQCILIPTHGVVGPKIDYFNHAFGSDENEFMSILSMPEKYIINRNYHSTNGDIKAFFDRLGALNNDELDDLFKVVMLGDKKTTKAAITNNQYSLKILELLQLYI